GGSPGVTAKVPQKRRNLRSGGGGRPRAGEVMDPDVGAAPVLGDEQEARGEPQATVEVAPQSGVLQLEQDPLGTRVLPARVAALQLVAGSEDELGGQVAVAVGWRHVGPVVPEVQAKLR